MKKTAIVLWVKLIVASIFIWSCKSDLFKSEEVYVPTEYETNLIDYFKEIAFKSEYDDDPERVIKWVKPMSLYVYKEKEVDEQMATLKNTIENINILTSDGFKIETTEDITKANASLFLCKRERFKAVAPDLYDWMFDGIVDTEFSGLVSVEYAQPIYVIKKALIFIDTESTIEEQKLAIIEGVTQSIGFLNNSDKYPDSVFYESGNNDDSENDKYSKMDRALISFLYNPKIRAGFRAKPTEIAIKKILKDENEALNR